MPRAYLLGIVVSVALCLLARQGLAQTLLKDINSDTAGTFGEFDNPEYTYLPTTGLVLFVANDGVRGKELWKTNGTTAGTAIVKDLKLFADANGNGSEPRYLTLFNNAVYFFANDGTGTGLWKSNGTLAGTTLVKNMDFATNIGSRQVRSCKELVIVGKYLYFYHAGISSVELWKSDGTSAKTQMVKDGFVEIRNLTVMGGLCYFAGQENGGNLGLWRSDGTAGGTVLVKEIGIRYELQAIDTMLFFVADDGTGDLELWRSDGTEYSTNRVKDIHPTGSANPLELTVLGKTLFFTASDGTNGIELWRSNGTGGNTVLVKNIHTSGDATPTGLTPMGSILYFVANDGSGVKLFKTDGTSQGTMEIKPATGQMNDPGYLAAVGNIVYFTADNASSGYELWKTNGTQVNTVMVKDIDAGGATSHSYPRQLTNCNGSLYFTAYDGSSMTRTGKIGREVWKSKGTGATTSMVADINTHSTDAFNANFDNANHLAHVGSNVYFVADDGLSGYEIYKSDGTTTNTKKLTDYTPDKDIHTLIGTTTTLFAVLYESSNYFLYKLNTVSKQLEKLGGTDVAVRVAGGKARVVSVAANLYYQRASDDQVWVTTGTTTGQAVTIGTTPVTGLGESALMGTTLYFVGADGLYRIVDGAAAAWAIADANWTAITDATNLTVFKNRLYFTRTGDGDIWQTYPTYWSAPATLLYQNPSGYAVDYLYAATTRLFFAMNEPGLGLCLWYSDLLAFDTVKDANNNKFYLANTDCQTVGSLLYFVAKTENETLFQSDSTTANTKAVKDSTGRTFCDVGHLTPVGSKLYFTYDNGVCGRELWESAGTTTTTKLTKDINPYGSTNFGTSIVVSGKWYFLCDDGNGAEYGHGKELWVK